MSLATAISSPWPRATRVVVLADVKIDAWHRSFEQLVLTACHPHYSATHGWIVFARLRGEAPSTSPPRTTT